MSDFSQSLQRRASVDTEDESVWDWVMLMKKSEVRKFLLKSVTSLFSTAVFPILSSYLYFFQLFFPFLCTVPLPSSFHLSSPPSSSCLQSGCSLSRCITVISPECDKPKQQHSELQYGHCARRHNAYFANTNRAIERKQNRWRMRDRERSDGHT